jgi:predicted RNA binding protein YcfA (HicA-like mRNA interferase family)
MPVLILAAIDYIFWNVSAPDFTTDLFTSDEASPSSHFPIGLDFNNCSTHRSIPIFNMTIPVVTCMCRLLKQLGISTINQTGSFNMSQDSPLGNVNCLFCWRMPFSGMWGRGVLVCTDVSEERFAPIFRVEKAASCSLWFLARGFIYPEDGEYAFLRIVGSHKIYTAPHPRKRRSS